MRDRQPELGPALIKFLRPTSIDVITPLTKIFCLPNGNIFALQHAAHADHNQPYSHSAVPTIVNDHQCGLIASPENASGYNKLFR